MQKASPTSLFRQSRQVLKPTAHTSLVPIASRPTFFSPSRNLAQVKSDHATLPEVWFTSSGPPRRNPEECGYKSDAPPPDGRTLKLGKSTLHLSLV